MENNQNHNNHPAISDELLAAFLEGNVNADEAQRILSSIGSDPALREALTVSQHVDRDLSEEKSRIIPMMALAAESEENLCSFDCETFILTHLNYDIDHWTLLETAKGNKWLREQGTPLHHVGRLLELKGLLVERKYDASLADLRQALEERKFVIAVIDPSALNDNTTDITDTTAAYHAIYITNVDDDGEVTYLNIDTCLEEPIDKETFLKAWKGSGFYMVAATDDEGGYNPQPIDVGDIDLTEELEDLTEAIAENAHDIWARARMDEGWTYGLVRDDAQKKHPDLVPYSRLPESEKEYDRLMAMNTLRLVRRLGFDIVNRNPE